MNKMTALKKYEAATRLRDTSPLAEWRKVFPSRESLVTFRQDVGDLSWPGSYGEAPWDAAFSLAWHLANGASEHSRHYMSQPFQDLLATYAEDPVTA